MGMYTELNIGVEVESEPKVINILKYMLGDTETFPELDDNVLFNTDRWKWMLRSDSYYFDAQTDSKLFVDELHGKDKPMYYLNVRCNLKNYCEEIDKFLNWLSPYIKTYGFIGYTRYEEYEDPTLLYKTEEGITYKNVEETS